MFRKLGLAALFVLGASPSVARADSWVVDNDASRLSFVSTKAGSVAEVHGFDKLSGSLTEAGRFELTIHLESINTEIDIRDKRMRELLFETERFPTARLSATLDMAQVRQIDVGEQGELAAEAALELHDMTSNLTVAATVARLDERTLLVSSTDPMVVTAGQFDLLEGVERLREIAGLPSISPAVPVSFRLTLRQDSASSSG